MIASAILASLEGESKGHESSEIRESWSDEIANRIADIPSQSGRRSARSGRAACGARSGSDALRC
ncbi:hypothetical protein [Rubripirellula reticaptiva]|uniref:hypothetical protein n=1 Tax=Rubripirellula reticaptiva TaxID=2528013 RepID=UPI001648F208